MRREVRRAGVGQRRRKRHAWGGRDSRLWAQGTRGTHVEHLLHGRDLGRVEAERLVERRRALPRVERRAYGAGRGSGRVAGGGRRPRRTQRAGREGSTADSGQGTGRSAR